MEENTRRPTLWIVIAGISVVVAIGLLVWALSLRSDLDSANERADRAEAAAGGESDELSEAERAAAATELKERVFGERAEERYRAVRAKFASEEKRADDLVADIDNERQQLAAVRSAESAAEGATEKARARLAAVEARAGLAAACARGVATVMDKFFEAQDVQRGADAALSHLERLQDKCQQAVAET